MKFINLFLVSVLLLGLILFSSCKTNHSKKATGFVKAESVNLHPEKLKEIKFSDYFSGYKTLNLNTDTSHMIGRIEKVLVGNGGKDLLVSNSRSLSVFDNAGNFIFNLKRGKGPGEFSSIASVQIGIPDSVFSFIDIYRQKLFIYGFDGKQKREVNLNILVESATPLNRNLYALYVTMPNDRTKYKLNFLDLKSGKIIKGYFPINKKYIRFLNLHSSNFFYAGSKLYFINTPFDTVYDISHFQDIPKPVYILNTGKHRLKKEYLNHDFNNIMELVNFTKRNAYAFFFNHFVQVNPFLFFSYSYAGRFYSAIYNLHTKKAVTLRGFTDDVLIKNHTVKMFNYFHPVGHTKDALIFAADPLQIKQQMDSLKQSLPPNQWLQIQKEDHSLYHIYKKITLKTNPVLFFYSSKKY